MLKTEIHALVGVILTFFLKVCEARKCSMVEAYCWQTGECELFLADICNGDCFSSEMSCDNGETCFSLIEKCDGYKKCRDGADEKFCTGCNDLVEKECDGGDTCYMISDECDGYAKCNDLSDEKGCLPRCDFLTCKDGGCYSPSQECDGQWDCKDGTDEGTDDESHCATTTHSPNVIKKSPTSSSVIVGFSVGSIALLVVLIWGVQVVRRARLSEGDSGRPTIYETGSSSGRNRNLERYGRNGAIVSIPNDNAADDFTSCPPYDSANVPLAPIQNHDFIEPIWPPARSYLLYPPTPNTRETTPVAVQPPTYESLFPGQVRPSNAEK